MRLFVTPASPWVRRVVVSLHELGMAGQVDFVPTRWPHAWATSTVAHGPLFTEATAVGRIPALVTDDGLCLADSDAICDYLNVEWGQYRLMAAHGALRTRQQAQVALGKAILEAQIARRAETLRGPGERSDGFIRKMHDRSMRCFAALDEAARTFTGAPDLAQITLGCACGFEDFRFPEDDWRTAAPQVAHWYRGFSERASMRATLPAETPQ